MKLWQQLLTPASEKRGLSLNELLGFFNDPQTGILNQSWGNLSDEELVTSVEQAYRDNGPVFALILARMQVFSQARFQWTRWTGGTPHDFFGSQDLAILEYPWPGGTTSDLLSRMEVYASTSGNAFVRRLRRGVRTSGTFEDRLVPLRPQWVTILMGSQEDRQNPWEAADVELLGYLYKPNGDAARTVVLDRTEVAHYAPLPDPVANFRGMSWITPVMKSVRADDLSEVHKGKFFENAATPNLALKFDPSLGVADIREFKELLEEDHKGAWNAYKTLYLGGGADPVTIGKDFSQMAFAETQGKGESRLASAAGVPPSWVGFSEGLQGSALNAGNFTAARRRFADGTMEHLWAAASRALEVIVDRPSSRPNEAPAQLWHDIRSIPFLREDAKDHAAIQQQEAQTMRTLIDAGYEPASVVKAVSTADWGALTHTGLFSVQLQPPGSADPSQMNGGADA
jgi:phage portal protein BeeE